MTDGEAANPGPRPSNWEPRRPIPASRAAILSEKERDKRARMLAEFRVFLDGAPLEALLDDADMCAAALEGFGRHLYSLLPRRHRQDYVAAILAVVDSRRSLRRNLACAWDFAAAWRHEEPGVNNLAMPAVVLRAFLTVALHWEWPLFALMCAIGFAGILRPSEFLFCTRSLVILPRDVRGVWYRCWLRIPRPKSRWAGARRQLARVDEWWVTMMAQKLLGDLPPSQRIWPASPASFRKRWDAVARALRMPVTQGSGVTPASLRGGGATAFYELTEDADRLRRRARWATLQSAEIYIQEVAPYEFLANLSPNAREHIFRVADSFEAQMLKFLGPEAQRVGCIP